MTLYSIQIFPTGAGYSRALGRRLVPRHRARRIVAWLNNRGRDAYIAPVLVTNPNKKTRELQTKIKVFETPNTFKLAFEVQLDGRLLLTATGRARRFQTREAAVKAATKEATA
jgi:hypothetical protein